MHCRTRVAVLQVLLLKEVPQSTSLFQIPHSSFCLVLFSLFPSKLVSHNGWICWFQAISPKCLLLIFVFYDMYTLKYYKVGIACSAGEWDISKLLCVIQDILFYSFSVFSSASPVITVLQHCMLSLHSSSGRTVPVANLGLLMYCVSHKSSFSLLSFY